MPELRPHRLTNGGGWGLLCLFLLRATRYRALQWIVRGLALRDTRQQPIDFPVDGAGIGAAGYQRRDGIGITGQGEQ